MAFNISKSLGLQGKGSSVSGVKKLVFIPFEEYTYTTATDGAISMITASSATAGFEMILPKDQGQTVVGFTDVPFEYPITVTGGMRSLNVATSEWVKSLEESNRFIVLAEGKKAGADSAWRVLGRYNGVNVTASNEDSGVTGAALVNTFTISGSEPVKPQWLELTAAQSLTDALTMITITSA